MGSGILIVTILRSESKIKLTHVMFSNHYNFLIYLILPLLQILFDSFLKYCFEKYKSKNMVICIIVSIPLHYSHALNDIKRLS